MSQSKQMAEIIKVLREEFQKGVRNTKTDYTAISTIFPRGRISDIRSFFSGFLKMKEWVGERFVKETNIADYQMLERVFAKDFYVEKADIENNEIGIASILAQQLGNCTALFSEKIVFGLLAKGMAEKCYDGKPFFAIDHSVDTDTVSNLDPGIHSPWYLLDCSRIEKPILYQEYAEAVLIEKDNMNNNSIEDKHCYGVDMRYQVGFGFWQTAYCSQKTLDSANFNDAYTAMQSFVDEDGTPLNIRPTHLVVPPSLHVTAMELVGKTLANSTPNPNFDIGQVIVSPWV